MSKSTINLSSYYMPRSSRKPFTLSAVIFTASSDHEVFVVWLRSPNGGQVNRLHFIRITHFLIKSVYSHFSGPLALITGFSIDQCKRMHCTKDWQPICTARYGELVPELKEFRNICHMIKEICHQLQTDRSDGDCECAIDVIDVLRNA